MMRLYSNKNFTMVEMLVVIAIMSILMGITMGAMGTFSAGSEVKASAMELKSTLENARALAARYNGIYSVVFNNDSFDSATDTIDKDNASGAHWYQIVTCDPSNFGEKALLAYSNNLKPKDLVGKRHTLQPGARFANPLKWTSANDDFDWEVDISDVADTLADGTSATAPNQKPLKILFFPTGGALMKYGVSPTIKTPAIIRIFIAKVGSPQDSTSQKKVKAGGIIVEVNKFTGIVEFKTNELP